MFRRIKTFRDISEYHLCCGCGVCAYLNPASISMKDFPVHGRRPVFRDSSLAEDYSQSFACCPGYRLEQPHPPTGTHPIPSLQQAWGTVLELWEGYAADPDVRFKGSSGGVATALTLFALEHQGLHGVLHTRAQETNPLENETILSRTRESILTAAGSRYSPASPCEKLSLVEKAPAPCLIIGKPCDIAAVRTAAQIRPELKKNISLTVACFCAGTPATDGTREMLRQMGIADAEALGEVRYRGHGWPGDATVRFQTKEKQDSRSLTYERAWGGILQKYRQWRCYLCPDHAGAYSDIALGDPWYRKPDGNDPGRSLILARTQAGRQIIQAMTEQGVLCAEKANPSTLPNSQPNLLKAQARLWGQLLALRMALLPNPTYSSFPLSVLWLNHLSPQEKLQSIVGTLRRVQKKKLYRRYHYRVNEGEISTRAQQDES